MTETFNQRAIRAIKKIPRGKVATYGQIASLAGNPRGAQLVVRVLNSSWKKEKLPWHRIINREGRISLREGEGYELQKSLLQEEGVVFDKENVVDLEKFQWLPRIKSL